MDPITIIGLVASLTNLIHASRSIVHTINSFKHGEGELLDLCNDVAIFTEALRGFERVLRSRQTIHRISGPVIENMIRASTETLTDLHGRVLRILDSDISAVRRIKWVQHMSGIKKQQERLKEQNAMLNTFLTITHAETFLAVSSQYPQYMLHDAATAIDDIEDEQSTEAGAYLKVPRPSSRARRSSSSSSLITVDSTVFSGETLSTFTSASSCESASPFLNQVSSSHRTNEVSKQPRISINDIGEAGHELSLALTEPNLQPQPSTRWACRYDCHCKCHEQNKGTSRTHRSKLKGSKLSCTDAKCLANITPSDRFHAHSRSFYRSISKVVSSRSIKVRYNLNTYRMVPEGSNAMRSIKHGDLINLKQYIESGQATIWDTAPDGWSLLHLATYLRQLHIVKYLVSLGVDTESGDIGSRKPADFAILKSIGQDATATEHEIVKIFSEKDDCLLDFEFTPIHVAVLELYDAKDTERPSLRDLLELADDANNAPANTNWAHWKLRYKSRSPLFGNILEYFRASAFHQPKGTKIIHNLLDQKDMKLCWTPLHWAASAGRVDKMRILVEHGANPSLLSNLNANILHAAAESKADHGLVEALKIWRRCPDRLKLDQQNKWAETALHMAACSSAACVKPLIEAGADPSIKQEDAQVALHCAGLSDKGQDRLERVRILCSRSNNYHINSQDNDGRPPLFDFLDDPECVEVLVNEGAQLDLIDDSGKNAFHHACIYDFVDALNILLSQSDDTRAATTKDYEGNCPLMEALSNTSVNCAMALLQLEDAGDLISKEGWAAVHYAAKIGDEDLLEAVFKHSSFMKGMETIEGKKADYVAMEAGNWHGRVKELIRKYDCFI